MKIKLRRDPYDAKHYIRKSWAINLEPGLTVLVGCNGAGKSTLLHQLRSYAHDRDIPTYEFDNLTYDGHDLSHLMNTLEDMQYVATKAFSSEGEKTIMRLNKIAARLGNFILKQHKDAPEIFVLMDALGSGTSIDNIDMIKSQLFDVILSSKQPEQNVYIVVATNEYEMCRGSRCFDVYNCRYREFKSYDAYRSFILRSRKIQDERDAKWYGDN